jgi:hypothetical protein
MAKDDNSAFKFGMIYYLTVLFFAIVSIVLCSCDHERRDNIISETHLYRVIEVNESTLLAIPTGLTAWGSDTTKVQKIEL